MKKFENTDNWIPLSMRRIGHGMVIDHIVISSSHGCMFVSKRSGRILYIIPAEPGGEYNLNCYTWVDLDEWKKFYNKSELPDYGDILDFGLQHIHEGYVKPDEFFREMISDTNAMCFISN